MAKKYIIVYHLEKRILDIHYLKCRYVISKNYIFIAEQKVFAS